MGADDIRWLILRTASARTLTLFRSLRDADIEAWTPIETIRRRRPRSRKTSEIEIAILSSFLFVRSNYLDILYSIPNTRYNPHPAFTIFHQDGRIPLICDHDMAALRLFEERARIAGLKRKRKHFEPGQAVMLEEGPFAGMHGTVERAKGRYTTVAFPGLFRVKIADWLLLPDDIQDRPSLKGSTV